MNAITPDFILGKTARALDLGDYEVIHETRYELRGYLIILMSSPQTQLQAFLMQAIADQEQRLSVWLDSNEPPTKTSSGEGITIRAAELHDSPFDISSLSA